MRISLSRKPRGLNDLEHPQTPETLRRLVRRALFSANLNLQSRTILKSITFWANAGLLVIASIVSFKAVVVWGLAWMMPILCVTAFTVAVALLFRVWDSRLAKTIDDLDQYVPRILKTYYSHVRIVQKAPAHLAPV